jgi:hypothetical protein
MAFTTLKRFLIGEPFPTSREKHERLDKLRALAVFASDPISSNAYATEAIMGILIVLGSGALGLTLPIALVVAALVLLVIFSYIQTILHYPDGGGAYTVAKDNLGRFPSLLAGGALLTDYILTVSVSTSAGVRAVTSAIPEVFEYRVWLAIAAILLITWINLRGVRESGTIFAVPTYAFVGGVLLVIVIGLVRWFGLFGAEPLRPLERSAPPRVAQRRHYHDDNGCHGHVPLRRHQLPGHSSRARSNARREHPVADDAPDNGGRLPLHVGAALYGPHPFPRRQHRLPGLPPPQLFSGPRWLSAALAAKSRRPPRI